MNADIAELGLLDDEEIDLDLAALALSELDHEGIDLQPYWELLDKIGERLQLVSEAAETPEQQATALARVFYMEYGFLGDASHYDAPLNADLIRVLDRKRGLPISLSILYVAAARRLGWQASALATPYAMMILSRRASMMIEEMPEKSQAAITAWKAETAGK